MTSLVNFNIAFYDLLPINIDDQSSGGIRRVGYPGAIIAINGVTNSA